MKRAFVISGVAGMTGSELARQALAAGDTVLGFDNFFASDARSIADCLPHKEMTFLELDLTDTAEMSALMHQAEQLRQKCETLIYVNCAAVVHTEYFYHIQDTFATNVLGMQSFLEQALQVGADVFINCSTSEVYSMLSYREGGVREEDFLCLATAEHSQRTSYATGKLLTEFFMKDAVDAGALRGASLRFANVYSERELYPKHIIPHLISSLSETGAVTLLENARETRRTFLYNVDSCRSILALLAHPESLDGSVYNVATSEEISVLDLAALIAKKLGISSPAIRFEGRRASDPPRRLLSGEKLHARTGWVPLIGLSEGIDRILSKRKERLL